jgi:tRNA threonylcarbamoyladenosine biosynthesis protein TsaE
MTTFVTRNAEETRLAGEQFAAQLRPSDVIGLFGNLGAGKTTFVQGVCRAFGISAHVSSPTFTLINEYHASFGLIVHADLYRITEAGQLRELGLEEYFVGGNICLIE